MSWTAYADGLLRRRRLLAAGALALVALGAWTTRGLRYNLTIGPLLQASPAQRERVEDFYRATPPARVDLILAVPWDRVGGPEELASLARQVAALEALPEVARTVSLADATVVDGGRPRRVAELVGDRRLIDVAREHPLLVGRLISRDGRAAAVWIVGARGVRGQRLLAAVRAAAPGARAIGSPAIDEAMKGAMQADLTRILLLELAILLVVLPLLFRTARGSLLPLLVVAGALALGGGLFVAADQRLSVIGLAIPGLVTIIALCDAVHLGHAFEERLAAHGERDRAVREALVRVGPACFHTSFTTALGFLSLAAAPHEAVRRFGVQATVAVVVAFGAVVALTPLGLALWPAGRASPALEGPLARLGFARSAGQRRLTWACLLVAVVGAAVGASRIVVEQRWLGELPRAARAVVDLDWYTARFAGLITLELDVRGELADPAVAAGVEALTRRLSGEPGVTRTESYVDWLREALGRREGPVDAKAGLALLRLAGGAYPRHVLDPTQTRARVAFQLEDVGTRRYLELAALLAAEARGLPSSVTATVGGASEMAHRSSHLVTTTLLRSFAVSLVAIGLFLGLAFRSLRLAVCALLASVFPVAVGLGVVGWLGIPMRVGVAVIFAVGLGLAVDDSIHVVARFRHERRGDPGASTDAVLRRTIRGTGQALAVTSLVLLVGACCHLPSAFGSLRDAGTVLCAIVVSAFAADVLVLPLLLGLGERTDAA